ncbi:DUF305 domain-containing protein [Pseudonocardia xishanensis]|uniref:DUF305 domain-containing protein n=1 Tax=Pseudonocardia xishanensis TaxID=630995 RepID=A0ABP8RGN0_9PSEU
MYRKAVLGVLAAAASLTVLAACSDGGDTSGASSTAAPTSTVAPAPSSAAAHNAADTVFVQGMIPHHSQAVAMADIAAQRATDTRVRQLAGRIQQAQGPEIEQLRGFLLAWGEPQIEAADPAGSMGGMDHGSMGHGGDSASGMSGMMTDQQMQQLQQTGGAGFDRMFLQMMIEHHNGAVAMAQTELAQGLNTEAKALAQAINDGQRAEIMEMQALSPLL